MKTQQVYHNKNYAWNGFLSLLSFLHLFEFDTKVFGIKHFIPGTVIAPSEASSGKGLVTAGKYQGKK